MLGGAGFVIWGVRFLTLAVPYSWGTAYNWFYAKS